MAFARDFFFPKKETDSRYNVIPIEVSFCIHGTTKLYGLHSARQKGFTVFVSEKAIQSHDLKCNYSMITRSPHEK